ncbi:MAG: flavodoxin family protein [Oscillospiraceae bacterium]|nr:flavodoxin family protein [Oscillospiraceae bacterium]
MQVILINGSPNREGCTYTALSIIEDELNAAGIETQMFQLGTEAIAGCRDCGYCFEHGTCAIGDIVNEFTELATDADGFIFGSPVHYASAGGSITAFMDRVFFSARRRVFRGKPAAAVVSCRRGGSTAALDQLGKYFAISQMPVVSSQYWNMIHGMSPDEVRQDLEGVQIMRTLGKNMAWLLRCINAGKAAGIELPLSERVTFTNFIR